MAKDYEIAVLLDCYGEVLTEKQRDVIDLYYNEDMSLAEIAENYKISRQGVRDSIKRAEGILTEMEEKLGFVKKQREITAKAEAIGELANNIFSVNESMFYSPQIRDSLNKIKNNLSEIIDI